MAQPEVVEVAAELLRRAEMGLISGLIYVAAVKNAKDEVGVCGDFSENEEYAKHAANLGFNAVVRLLGTK